MMNLVILSKLPKTWFTFRRKFIGQYCNQPIAFPNSMQGAIFGGGSNNGQSNAGTANPSTFTTQNYATNATTATPMSSNNCDQFYKIYLAVCMPDSCNNADVKRAVDTSNSEINHFIIIKIFFSYVWKVV